MGMSHKTGSYWTASKTVYKVCPIYKPHTKFDINPPIESRDNCDEILMDRQIR